MRLDSSRCNTDGSHSPEVHFFSFLCKALIWGAITFYIAEEIAYHHFWVVCLSVFLFSIPFILCGLYSNTIRQIRRLTIFKEKGWIYKLLSTRLLKSILWALWALVSSFFMLLLFHTYSKMEWLVFFLVIPIFWITFKICHHFIAQEIAPYMVTEIALVAARKLCPLLMLIIYFVFMTQGMEKVQYIPIHEAISSQKSMANTMDGSAIVQETSHLIAIYQGIKIYAFGQVGSQDTIWAAALMALGQLVILFNTCAILSCFLIPSTEYRRIIGPLDDAHSPSPLPTSRIALAAAIFSFTLMFIYLPIFASIENWAHQTSARSHSPRDIEHLVVQKVEQIDGLLYKEGTITKLAQAKFEALSHIELAQADMQANIDSAFDLLEMKVDDYLDWYYSLSGEYTRIAKLMVGELEAFMISKLEEFLLQGDAFNNLQIALDNLISSHQEAERAYQAATRQIMQAHIVDTDVFPVQVIQQVTSHDRLISPLPQDVINMHYRLGGGAMTGMITAAVTGKIIAKIAGKNTLKLAAGALLKIVASKTAGAAAGAGAGALGGAAVGSVVPGAGTLIGATIGGIIGGVGTGIAVDKMLIELEEAISREKFKTEILAVIQEVRHEFKTQFDKQNSE